jgi:hypothetical protein
VSEVVPPIPEVRIFDADEIEAWAKDEYWPSNNDLAHLFASHEALRARVEELTVERDALAAAYAQMQEWYTAYRRRNPEVSGG